MSAMRTGLLATALGMTLALAGGEAHGQRASGSASGVGVTGFSGLKRALRKGKGRVTLVHLWATWCAPCLDELSMINDFKRATKARGLDLISVSLDDTTRAQDVARVLDQRAPDLSRIIAPPDDVRSFVAGFDPEWSGEIPAFFVFDQGSELRSRQFGAVRRFELENLVGYLLKPPAPAGTTARKRCPKGQSRCS